MKKKNEYDNQPLPLDHTRLSSLFSTYSPRSTPNSRKLLKDVALPSRATGRALTLVAQWYAVRLTELDAGVRWERCAQKRCDWLDRVGGAVGSSVLNSLSPPPSWMLMLGARAQGGQ